MTHHSPDLGEATTFPLILFFVFNHGGYIQMSFCLRTPNLGVPKFPKMKLSTLWRAIISYANLWLRWGLKQSYNPCQDLSKNMLHTTCMHVFQGEYWFLVVRSQIGTLSIGPSFGHNLCFKYSNGLWEPILDFYASRSFQLYKKLFNLMNYDPWNTSLKIWESIGIPIPKVGAHLGMFGFIPSHCSTLLGTWNVIPRILLSAHTFASPCLGRKLKAKVATKLTQKRIPMNHHNLFTRKT
jgi:hypothetical protein